MLARQRQPHLAQQFVLQSLIKITVFHGRQRAKMQATAGGDNRIHWTYLLEQRLDALLRGHIHLLITVRTTHTNHLVATAQCFRYRTTYRTAGTNNDDFHS
ncbi:hypothetical protein D3C80_1621670 [compost metagenome]